MKKTNKTLMAIAASALMIFVTACSNSESGSDVSSNSNNSDVSVSSDSNDSSAASTMHGTWSGTTYTSAFLGIKGEFASEWTPLTDDYLLEQSGITDFSDSTLKSASAFYEMAVQKENGDNVNIVVQNLTASGESITGEDYVKSSVDALKQVYSALDENASIKQEQITFTGETMSGVSLSYSIDDVAINQMQVYLFKENYVAVITFTASDNETAPSDIAAMFSAL